MNNTNFLKNNKYHIERLNIFFENCNLKVLSELFLKMKYNDN